MPNIQIVKENSLGLNRGIYADWMGNALSDANANTLLTEGSAVTVGYREPSLNDALNASQQANTNIKGVAGVGNGKVFDEQGNIIISLISKSIGLSKSWPTAGGNVGTIIAETSAQAGTFYAKRKLPARPKRARPILIHRILRQDAYNQSGTNLTISTTYTKGVAVDDRLYIFPNSGTATQGWVKVNAVVPDTSITVTALDSQTASGNVTFSKPLKGIKIACALTEIATYNSTDDLVTPTVGGVQYNSAYSVSNMYGFKTIDFSPDVNSNAKLIGDAPAAKLFGISSANATLAVAMAGQWVSLPDVPSLDGDGANFLYRLYHDPVSSGTRSSLSGVEQTYTNSEAYRSLLGIDTNPYIKRNWQTFRQGVDGVATLTTLPTSSAPGSGVLIAWEFDYGIETVGVCTLGDSTTAHNKYLFDYGIPNGFSANFAGSTMTLTANITQTLVGVQYPCPLSIGQALTFTGQNNNADGTSPYITGLISGVSGQAGAVYSLSNAQTTANGVSVTSALNWFNFSTSWSHRAVYEKSTPDKPYSVFNGGMGAHRSTEYLAQIEFLIAQGVVPDVVQMQGWSINNNGGNPSTQELAEERARILNTISVCRKAGVRKVLASTWPKTKTVATNPTSSANIDVHNAWLRGLATQKITDGCPDFAQVCESLGIDLFYSPDGTIANAVSADWVHPGRGGVDGMSAEFKKFI